MRKNKKNMLELKALIQSLTLIMQTFEDHIIGRILNGLKLQHDEPSVHIKHDVVDAAENNVTRVNDVLDDAVAGDLTLQSVDVEGNHVLEANTVVEATTGEDGNLALVEAEGDHVLQNTPEGNVSRVSSLELSDVHHRDALISNPTEWVRVNMTSKYMASQ
ncbi:Uncharacterized protein TCM_028882 [Theobroma cacao]|uniref:Uncharacterized protein n=1 Tax=Theobroma cacao TaxID=3641 RepID=A0A061GBY5_THECC|nr:Uncharacterized protein TCM_028882 [Theobroma cacao]